MDALIEERTGAKPGTIGGFFTLNPQVSDIPERFSVVYRGVRLLEMGSVDMGGSGCICPEAAMLKTLFTHLLFRKDEVLIWICTPVWASRSSYRGFRGCHAHRGRTHGGLWGQPARSKLANDIGLRAAGWWGIK
jgi:hypothetical protein